MLKPARAKGNPDSPQPEAKKPRVAPQADQLLVKRLEILGQVQAELGVESSVLSQTVAAYTLLIDEVLEQEAREVHAGVSSGQDDLSRLEANYELIPPLLRPAAPQASGHSNDAFGQNVSKAGNAKVSCPVCQRELAASRFAPHLERCLGSSNGRSGTGRTGRMKTVSDSYTS